MSDLDQILSDEELEPVEPVDEVETVEEEVEAAPAEAEPEAEPAPESKVEPEENSTEKEVHGLKAALSQTRAELREMKQIQNRPPAQPAPEFIDPEGAQYIQREMQTMQFQMDAKLSEKMALYKHGEEAVGAAFAAAEEAGMLDTLGVQPDAWEALVKWHKTEKVRAEIGDDAEAWKADQRKSIRAEVKAELVADQARSVPNAPSLASEPNLGTVGAPAWSGPPTLEEILNGS